MRARTLICNLVGADFIMGIYLGFLAECACLSDSLSLSVSLTICLSLWLSLCRRVFEVCVTFIGCFSVSLTLSLGQSVFVSLTLSLWPHVALIAHQFIKHAALTLCFSRTLRPGAQCLSVSLSVSL